jgi:hypothetical protein
VLLLTGALCGPQPAVGQAESVAALDSLTRARIDALGADAGTPAYRDGFAGLLVIHAGRDPVRARAMARYARARTPAAADSVSRALAMAGLGKAVGDAGSVPATAADRTPGVPADAAEGRSGGLPSWPIGYRPLGFGEAARDRAAPIAADLGQRFDDPDDVAGTDPQIQIRGTLRPGPGGLASPQLR